MQDVIVFPQGPDLKQFYDEQVNTDKIPDGDLIYRTPDYQKLYLWLLGELADLLACEPTMTAYEKVYNIVAQCDDKFWETSKLVKIIARESGAGELVRKGNGL